MLILPSLIISLSLSSIQVLSVVHQLRDCGFVEVEVEVEVETDQVRSTEGTSKVSSSAVGKSKRSKEIEIQESGGPSSRGKQKVLKKEEVNHTDKRPRKELEGIDQSSRDVPSRVGYIEGAANRFYESSKKAKRKKLRAC
jgi:hypothetical protein